MADNVNDDSGLILQPPPVLLKFERVISVRSSPPGEAVLFLIRRGPCCAVPYRQDRFLKSSLWSPASLPLRDSHGIRKHLCQMNALASGGAILPRCSRLSTTRTEPLSGYSPSSLADRPHSSFPVLPGGGSRILGKRCSHSPNLSPIVRLYQ